LLLVALVVAVGTRPALATIVAALDLAQLVERADRVVHGLVISVSAVRMEGRYTESVVTIAPVAVMKGAPDSEIAFRVPGGEIGRFRTFVVGAPTFRAGDEVVVFLAGAPPYLPHLVGFSQGVLPVVRDDTGRAVLIVPPSAGTDGEGVAIASGAARVMTLSAFADDVRALVEGRRRSREAVRGRAAAAGRWCP
jgi:hypothetical protein